MNIGVLTGGGDCPGLNAVIRAIVRKAGDVQGDKVFGFYDAWDGVLEQRYIELTTKEVRGILPRGGTILGTCRSLWFGCNCRSAQQKIWPNGRTQSQTN